jgi:hypothetical protein
VGGGSEEQDALDGVRSERTAVGGIEKLHWDVVGRYRRAGALET